MTEIVTAVAGKVSEYLVAPIGRQLGYLFCYRSHTDELRNNVQKLGKAREDVQITFDEALQRGDEIRPIVQDWLNPVEQITREAEELMMKDENNKISCFNLKSRYQLGRQASKKAQVIVEIQEARDFPDGVSYRLPPRTATFKEYESFDAREVVEECQGLPVAIVTIAKVLKGKNMVVWKNALEELRSSEPTNIRGVEEKVHACLELSYNHLKSNAFKSLFLLCGMLSYGDIWMDDLLRYAMGLDSFDRIKSLEEARNKLVALLTTLKTSSLLLEGDYTCYFGRGGLRLLFVDDDNKCVKMHDVVRDITRNIASKDPHRFVVREDDWSKTDESLYRKAVHELPQRLVCPELQFFLFQSNLNIGSKAIFRNKLRDTEYSGTSFETQNAKISSKAVLQTPSSSRDPEYSGTSFERSLRVSQVFKNVALFVGY